MPITAFSVVEIEHAVAKRLVGAVARKRAVVFPRGSGERAHDAAREDDEAEAESAELICREERRVAALDHVGEERPKVPERGRHGGELIARLRRLHEQYVGAGFGI